MQIRTVTVVIASLGAFILGSGPAGAQAWETLGGLKVRKNPQAQAVLSGATYSYYNSYNSGGGSGGYAAEYHMVFCPGGKMGVYGQDVTTMNVPGLGGSSVKKDSDVGEFSVYEDQGGKLFVHLKLKKAGEGFFPYRLNAGKLTVGTGKVMTPRQGGC